jgi:hypothetical protein
MKGIEPLDSPIKNRASKEQARDKTDAYPDIREGLSRVKRRRRRGNLGGLSAVHLAVHGCLDRAGIDAKPR